MKLHDLKKLHDLEMFMLSFRYVPDKPFEWVPWESTAYHRFKDDCDGAAVLWNWGFKKLGLSSSMYRLKGKEGNHRITISFNKTKKITYIGSNNTLVKLKTDDWENEVLRWFDYKYTGIIKL